MKKRSSPHSCNVLQVGRDVRQLWQFSTRSTQVSLLGHRRIGPKELLPAKIVGKDWSTVFQAKLNVAWLPADQVFLRVVHLPTADRSEMLSMVELQLEKLSPLPVNQIVWSVEWVGQGAENLQTLIVVIAPRLLVEEFLGKLESDGFITDRLEVPCLHQLRETPFDEDGVWLYPTIQAGSALCLVAWRSQGKLQQLQLIHLPEGENRSAVVIEQLTKTAWAGEVEGWLNPPARCHLVADHAIAPLWEPALRQWSGQSVVITEPLPEPKLGEVAARQGARGEENVNLLPTEYAVRYRQQMVDRLWMGSLGAILGIYVIGVLIYFGLLQVENFKCSRLEGKVAALSGSYTNALRLKEKIEVLQNQQHLKYAALDCLKAISEKLPTDLTLVSFQFQRGAKVILSGTAPSDQTTQITDYNEDLSKVKIDGQLLFSKVSPPKLVTRASAGGQTLAWDFTCDLNRRETE